MRAGPRGALLLTLAFSCLPAARAHAQLEASVGVQALGWTERSSPLEVQESGPLAFFGLGLVAPRKGVVRVGYRGRGGIGVEDYRGAFLASPTTPVHTQPAFGLFSHQAQLRVRSAVGVEAVASLELDLWYRQLGAHQEEDYRIVSAGVGAEWADRLVRGWSGGGGVRIPVSAREDAHFDDLGFRQNPILEPKGRTGLFGDLRYRFSPRLSCAATLDLFHFEKSDRVTLTRGNTVAFATQPPTDVSFASVGLIYTR